MFKRLYIFMIVVLTLNGTLPVAGNDLTYQEWQDLEAARMAPAPVVKPKKSPGFSRSFVKDVRRPLEAIARETLTPEAQFMESEIAKRAPEVEKARAAYGDVIRTYENSPAHKQWQEQHAKWLQSNNQADMPAPIVFEYNLAWADLEKRHRDRRKNLVSNMMFLYDKKRNLEKNLASRSWMDRLWNPMPAEAAELAAVNMDLRDIDNALEYDLPMYEGVTRMRQQDVRQKRLAQLKKDIAHPSDRFISNKPFIESYLHNTVGPTHAPYAKSHKEMVDYWKRQIHHADQGGLEHLHGNLDEELRQQIYHQSEAELEKAIAARNPENDRYAREWFEPMWTEELARREYRRQKRAGINEPELLKPWFNQAWKKAEQRREEERKQYWR